jgi:hypothetical protein
MRNCRASECSWSIYIQSYIERILIWYYELQEGLGRFPVTAAQQWVGIAGAWRRGWWDGFRIKNYYVVRSFYHWANRLARYTQKWEDQAVRCIWVDAYFGDWDQPYISQANEEGLRVFTIWAARPAWREPDEHAHQGKIKTGGHKGGVFRPTWSPLHNKYWKSTALLLQL